MDTLGRRALVALVVIAAALLGACSDEATPGTNEGWERISAEELDARRAGDGGLVLVNVHVPFEGDIPRTDASIPYTELASRIDELPDDASSLVIYCRSGNMSTTAAEELVAAGYSGFAELDGGFIAWEVAGLPLET